MCVAVGSCVVCSYELCSHAKKLTYNSSQLCTSTFLYKIEVIKLVKSCN